MGTDDSQADPDQASRVSETLDRLAANIKQLPPDRQAEVIHELREDATIEEMERATPDAAQEWLDRYGADYIARQEAKKQKPD